MSEREDVTSLPIRSGTKTIRVDMRPVEVAGAEVYDARLVEVPFQCLIFKHPRKQAAIGLVFLGIAGILFAVVYFGIRDFRMRHFQAVWFVLQIIVSLLFGLLAIVFVVAGVIYLIDFPCYRFDRRSGRFSYGFPGLRRSRPLEHVVGVQLIRQIVGGSGCGQDDSLAPPAVTTYQLNVVLDDPLAPRITLCAHKDLGWIKRAARKLADLLGVPILDGSGVPGDEPVIIDPRRHRLEASTRETADAAALSVETTPIAAAWSNVRDTTFSQLGPETLVIKSSGRGRMACVCWVAVGLALFCGFLANFGQLAAQLGFWQTVLLCAAPLLFVPLGLFFLARWPVRFDRTSGGMTYGPPWSRTQRSLADILAVQVTFGGEHPSVDDSGSSDRTYQLNLVFNDAAGSRLNLSNHSDRQWTLEAGHRLANFLGVSLLDQLARREETTDHVGE